MAQEAGLQTDILTLPIEHGFETPDFLLVSEQDLLGERIIRTEKRKRQSDAFLIDATALAEGELIVHKEHGIGRFDGLMTLEAGGAKHDCLKLVYADDAKLFLPVVNMELIARFGFAPRLALFIARLILRRHRRGGDSKGKRGKGQGDHTFHDNIMPSQQPLNKP